MTGYRSEIRASEVSALLDKVRRKKYGNYLLAMRLSRVRAFQGARVEFEFPVTALIGPNGGGKSTILGAAACAYKAIKPSLFFPKSSIGDDSMADWTIEYDCVDRKLHPTNDVRRSSRFRQLQWRRDDVLSREVIYFGINRTVPAGEKSSFKKLMKPSYRHDGNIKNIDLAISEQIEKILGKPVSAFKVTDIPGKEFFYIGGNNDLEYSEFHFGAGEASVIRMITKIESSPDNSLILIEEIENGLHPIAVRRLVEYFLALASRKSCQVIFTTHSDYALEPLPPEAIWASIDGKVQQGKLTVETLRAVSGRVDKKLAIFVEDNFAKCWVDAILREKLGKRFDQVEVYPVSGDGNARSIHIGHLNNPSITSKSICLIDGDSQQPDEPDKGIYRLPGNQPEATVFEDVYTNIDSNIAILTVSCQLAPEKQDQVRSSLDEVSCTNRDPHLIYNQIGIKVGFVPEVIVRGAFLTVWIRENPEKVNAIVEPIEEVLKSTDGYQNE
ncbi:ATP-dependent nuclease [Coleofasciculus chthonoplastes]|uniref:ATP-dependent nuclease n=1 Tax=Coleofasciculus chthonoplastes TaxID=64178 RepID=UPI0032F49E01